MHSFVFGNDFTKQPEKHQPIEKMQCENVEGSSTRFFRTGVSHLPKHRSFILLMAQENIAACTVLPALPLH